MIETVHVHVCSVCMSARSREDVGHYDDGTAPLWLPAIYSQAPHFKWIFDVCCFITYPVCTAAPQADHIDSVPSSSPPYHLISVLVTLNQQNGTY